MNYNREQAQESSLSYFKGDELAASTFVGKYALKENGMDGQTVFHELNPDDMHHRLAREIGRIEANYGGKYSEDDFYQSFKDFKYIVPQGSPMFGIGNPYAKVSLSNCTVLDYPKDNISSIFNTARDSANLYKARCGVGVNVSMLRPDGSKVSNSAGSSTGAWSFCDLYSYVCRMIGQFGRRGALMIAMDIRHPDIDKFITMKRDLTKVTGANVSVMLTDEFMNAVDADAEWICRFPIESSVEEAKCTKAFKARELWHLLNESAVKCAEPGLIFFDNYANNLPAHNYPGFKSVVTNPCGEILLSAGDSCRLTTINLKNFVRRPFEPEASFDFDKFNQMVRLGMRVMDNIVDLEIECLDEIIEAIDEDDERILWDNMKRSAVQGRRTGLGTHALADTLACLNIKYDSDEAINMVNRIYQSLRDTAYDESVEMAKERGAFPAFDWDTEKDNIFIKRLPQYLQDRIKMEGRRNISILTLAPTGCQKPDTLLITDAGILRLDEIVSAEGKQWQNISVNVSQEHGYQHADKGFINGYVPTKKILLRSGIELESTANHQYRIIREGSYIWCRAEEIKCNDIIPVKIGGYAKTTDCALSTVTNPYCNARKVTLPDKMSPKLAWLLGHMFANGSVHKSSSGRRNGTVRISIHEDKKDVISNICASVKDLFGFEPTINDDKREKAIAICISSTDILEWMENNDLLKQKSNFVAIPMAVRCSSRESVESFIQGYWEADGSSVGNVTYIDTTSYQMAQQLMVLIRATGNNCYIQKYSDRSKSIGNAPLYRVRYVGYGSEGFDRYRYVSKTIKRDMAIIRELVGDGFAPDYVDSISDSFNLTLDISVPENNCYIANSAVSHNTVSIVSQTSSGIEPVFMNFYTRRKKINHADTASRVDFVDQSGDKWQEFPVFHHNVTQYLEHTGTLKEWDDLKETIPPSTWGAEVKKLIPDFFTTAMDIDPKRRVEIQGVITQYLDHGSSSTINMPAGTTVKECQELYYMAWKHGLKGVTIYVDGSRSGVLVSSTEKPTNSIVPTTVPKRPKSIPCDIHRHMVGIKSKNQDGTESASHLKFIILVGTMNGAPYELFVGLSENITIPAKIDHGSIIKRRNGKDAVYDLVVGEGDDEWVIKDIISSFRNDYYAEETLRTSLELRNGIDLKHIIKSTSKSKESDLYSFYSVVNRVLKKYIKDGEVSGVSCKNCGEKLVFSEGCQICRSCGDSKCG